MANDRSEQDQRRQTEAERALRTLAAAIGAGAVGAVLYALPSGGWSNFFSVASVGLMVGGASLLLGGVLGFLFGIPRTLQGSGDEQGEPTGGPRGPEYRVNTNLEQISDWLTKMLVGVGLTQLTSVPSYLQSMTTYLAPGLGASASSPVFALAILVYFSVTGFLFGYLWTRLYLAGAFRRADLAAIGRIVEQQVDPVIARLKAQQEADAEAEQLAQRQLNPSREFPAPVQEELNAAFTVATDTTRVKLFTEARTIRSDNWRSNKPMMERTIPIFRALIAADANNEYHSNHGQLGFALKDKDPPDWREAERELTLAIEMRGDTGHWIFYEFNRALCRIHLDEALQRGEASDDATREAIVSDLAVAWQSDLMDLVRTDAEIKKWLSVNGIRHSQLNRQP